MDLLALSDFNLVAMHGGFGRASRASGRPKATLSRRVMELEESLGVRLVERGSRILQLTREGAALHARTEGLLAEIAEVGETIGAGLDRLKGRLRIASPVLFAHIALARIAAGFTQAYPEIQLEITAADKIIDPIEEGYDVVIRINPIPDDRLVGRCFLHDEVLIVAHASLARPAIVSDGASPVRAVALSLTLAQPGWRIPRTIWRVANGQEVLELLPDPALRLSSLLMVRDAVLAGAGAALVPRSVVAGDLEAGRLVCWGVADERPVNIWVLHTSRRLISGKVRAFCSILAIFPAKHLSGERCGACRGCAERSGLKVSLWPVSRPAGRAGPPSCSING